VLTTVVGAVQLRKLAAVRPQPRPPRMDLALRLAPATPEPLLVSAPTINEPEPATLF
jgi:hypothetical protein